MKILYDNQIFNQKFGGISKIFVKRFEEITKNNDIDISLPIKHSENIHLLESKIFDVKKPEYSIIEKTFFKKKTIKKLNRENQDLINDELNKGDFDIFHPTFYDPYFLNNIKKPFVIDIHDLIPEIFPEFFSLKFYSTSKELIAKKANKIIAISNKTKKDIINFFDIDEEKIEVIYHGNTFENINIDEIHDGEFENSLPKKYILFVGNRSGYKNFYFFLSAIKDILKKDEDLKLVCTGEPFSKKELSFIKSLDLSQKILNFNRIDEKSLILLYKNSSLFAFPSLYEGFGLPILEAFTCKTPVIASDIESMHEIGSDAMLYFDPKSKIEIENAVLKTLYQDSVANKLIEKGYSRQAEFSLNKSVNSLISLYKTLDC